MPNMRPRFGDRILTVGATWGVVALVALKIGLWPAMLLSLIPLGLAARAAWLAHKSGRTATMEMLMARQVTAIAMLIATTLFAATLWVLRDRVPTWLIPVELGLLLHYWLLTLR
ncbi:MAG TPA: hypothetical protein VNT75_25260 [Symbiobacteriaceae bacterium]|nr:hypothetical protein [Symbiobacteriaceae bacterium]